MNYIQDIWYEDDDDLVEFLRKSNMYTIVTEDEIVNLDIQTINCLFADTKLITKLFNRYDIDIESRFPTYPDEFKELYHRKITLSHFDYNTPMPFFIKPLENKLFSGMVVREKLDLDFLKETLLTESLVYISELVEFVNEYRIFYEKNNSIIIETSKFLIPTDIRLSHDIPNIFLEKCYKILDAMPEDLYVLDVGMLKTGEWAVVEMNPPYSLESYDLGVVEYYNYCCKFWKNSLTKLSYMSLYSCVSCRNGDAGHDALCEKLKDIADVL